ncbi:heme exporter protein B [Rhodobium orientis]|uniref:Heme exporter protein B n=1 Tax=Rhodobium orientis TaxID=34017 RepID=A0A327JLA1_9HYPH|nr:heme exporter protein CcmB [Rhodobium orientis]MBB4305191.1 heme exporter protein B [Rhodobium orientis]MBK5948706.1 heme exporter protein CcmB [Rhodobium orientis]RAI26675.1 heme exporter protein CcmB [Rhodobium orientis]
MTGAFSALFVREIRLAVRVGGGALMGVLFFLTVVSVFPFAVGPDLKLLSRIGPAILWIGALLATLLSLDRLFQSERDDGTLDLLLLGEHPIEVLVFVKAMAHWVATGLPLVLAAPVLGIFVNLQPIAIGAVMATLFVGTPALTAIGAIGAALTVSLRRGGVLLAILVLPLTIPVLIFGVSAATAAVTEPTPFLTPFLFLCGLSLLSMVFAPIAAAAALRRSGD